MRREVERRLEPTKRQKRSKAYESRWCAIRAQRAEARKKNYTKGRAAGRISSPLQALKIAAGVTKDPRFVEAIEATKFWGLDGKKFLRKAHVALNDNCLIQVDRLYLYGDGSGHRFSVVEACECVIAENGLGSPTATFESEVERLRQAWILTRSTTVCPPWK